MGLYKEGIEGLMPNGSGHVGGGKRVLGTGED